MKKSDSKVLNFFKRNAVYLILALCIVAVGLSVTFVLLNRNVENEINNNDIVGDTVIDDIPTDTPIDGGDTSVDDIVTPDTPVEPVVKPVTFIMPVENATEIGEYSEQMVFNSTLGRFNAHLAIDFFAPEGTNVLAVYGGTVESVNTTLLTGTTVVINHGNGLKTIYNSLADGDAVSVGQTVNQGDVIGQVSLTNRQEYKAGAHLHFQVEENGEIIDPVKYLTFNEK